MIRAVAVLMAAAAAPASAQEPRPPLVGRAAIVTLEQSFEGKVRRAAVADPLEIMSSAQGVYVEGFGLVLTAQVDLIATPALNPFRQKMSKSEIDRIRARKADHLPLLRQIMQQMMVEAASSLNSMPPGEEIVLAVSLFRMNWEDSTGLPGQILMRAARSKLLERALSQKAIHVQEF